MCFVENSVCYFKKQSNLHIRGGSPYFSIYCLINSFFHEQLVWQSVLIILLILEAQAEITELINIHGQPVILITENNYQTNVVCTVMLTTLRVAQPLGA